MLYAFLGGWVPRDDGCCTLFQVGGSPDGGKGTVTYLPWERNATLEPNPGSGQSGYVTFKIFIFMYGGPRGAGRSPN